MKFHYHEMHNSFTEALNAELDALCKLHSEEFSCVASAAFLSTNVFELLQILCESESKEDLHMRAEHVVHNIGQIMTAILTMMARNLNEDEVEKVMRFADRMHATQRATVESMGALKQ